MFEVSEFWEFAKRLVGHDEATQCEARTAAGRAYYGMFLTLRSRYEDKSSETIPGEARGHADLRRGLRAHGQHALSEALSHLYRLREEADYRPEAEVTADYVRYVIDANRGQFWNAQRL